MPQAFTFRALGAAESNFTSVVTTCDFEAAISFSLSLRHDKLKLTGHFNDRIDSTQLQSGTVSPTVTLLFYTQVPFTSGDNGFFTGTAGVCYWDRGRLARNERKRSVAE